MAGDDQELAVGTEADALHRERRSVQVEQLDALDLEVAAVILVNVEHLEQPIVWTYDQVLTVRREITTLADWGKLDGVYETSFIWELVRWIQSQIFVETHWGKYLQFWIWN